MAKYKHSSRQRILDVARKRIMTDGYRATSTRKIAEEVGITQPNLYYHFKNKEELFVAVLDQVGEGVNEDLNKIVHSNTLNLQEKLTKMSIYLQNSDSIDIYTMMKDMQSDLSEESRQTLYQIFTTSYKQPFIDLFTEHQNEFRVDLTPQKMASYYYLTIAPYVSSNDMIRKLIDTDKLIDLFLNGIKGN